MMSLIYQILTRRYRTSRLRPATVESHNRRKPKERGAAIVEFSLVASLLMTLAIGTYELGMAWNDAQLVTQAARSGARVAAQLGSDAQTDQRILESVEAALGDLESGLVTIVIFDAAATDGQMSNACESANHPGRNGQCSVYGQTEVATFSQGSWLPADRNDELGQSDYVGVRVEIDRPFLSGFFGPADLTITDQAVMRIEPRFDP